MSILIKGVTMPKNCKQCFYRGSGCRSNKHNNGRPQDCLLIEIQPHGRLIDADVLMLKIKDYIDEYDELDENGYHDLKWCAMKEAEAAIEALPIIIPEEPQKEE